MVVTMAHDAPTRAYDIVAGEASSSRPHPHTLNGLTHLAAAFQAMERECGPRQSLSLPIVSISSHI
jgi:hypothetical protein